MLYHIPIIALAWAFASATAGAAMLLPVTGTPHANAFEVFYVIENPADTPQLVAIVPRRIDIRLDDVSNSWKFGIQYLFEAGSPDFVNLTAAVAFEYDQSKADEILEHLRKTSAVAQLKSLPLTAFEYTLKFVHQKDGLISSQGLGIPPGHLTSVAAVSLNLSGLGKQGIKELLEATSTTGGFIADIRAPYPIVEKAGNYEDWKTVVDWALATRTLTRRELNLPTDPKIRKLTGIREAMATLLGPPAEIKTSGGFQFGWDLGKAELADKLEKQLQAAKTESYQKLTSGYSADAFFSLHEVCTRFKSQIVNIATGEVGCEGLTQ